tara:strand:- start:457 stop:870 length:414 start_codon:yes stop_codon:yes gene_type:complete
LSEIVQIEKDLFSQPWSEQHFKEEINKISVSRNWVIIKNTELVGYVFGWMIKGEFHLNNIAVKKKFQNKGVGNRLLSKVIDFTNSQNGTIVFLEVMHENKAAIHLYERNGFSAVGKRKNYYTKGKHAILYELELNNG